MSPPPGNASRGVLRTVLVAEVLSMSGSQLSAVAMPWFVLESTGSAADMGVVMAAQMIAVALFGVLGAPLSGRLGPRRVLVASDYSRALLVALVPLLHQAGLLPLPVVMLLLFAIGSFFAPYTASQQALLPFLAGEDEKLLSQANASLQGATRLAILIAPPVSGLLVSWLGAPTVLLLDAGTYLVSALILGLRVPRGLAPPVPTARRNTRAAVQVLRRDRLLSCWTIGQVLTETAWQALFVLLPVLAREQYGGTATLAGLLLGAFGGGALTGTLLVGRALRRLSPTRLSVFGRIGQTVAFFALLLPLNAPGLAAVLFTAGLLNGLSNGPIAAVRTARIPAPLRSTALTLIAAFGLTGGSVGLVTSGAAAESLSSRTVFTLLALCQVLAAVCFVLGARRPRRGTAAHTPRGSVPPVPVPPRPGPDRRPPLPDSPDA